MSFFHRLEKELLSQKKTMTKHLTILEKAQKASYEVAYLIAKDKNHTARRNPHQTCCYCNQSNYERRKGNRGNKKMPLSANIICRRISEMDQDIQCQLIDRVKREKYAL